MIKSYQNKLVAVVSRATKGRNALAHNGELHLLLLGPTAMSCAPRAL
jgi:hypothetical protein